MRERGPKVWKKYQEEARDFRHFLHPRKRDLAVSEKCGRRRGDLQPVTFYAVDTDVIKFFIDPEGNSKYASLFSDDEKDVRACLAIELSRYLFTDMDDQTRGDFRYLIVPPHEEELIEVAAAIERSARDEGGRIGSAARSIDSNEQIRRMRSRGEYTALADYIIKNAPEVVSYVYNREKGTFAAQLDRLSYLLAEGRLVGYAASLKLPIPDFEEDVNIRNRFNMLVDTWYQHLIRFNRNRAFQISRDAEALARVHIINDVLVSEYGFDFVGCSECSCGGGNVPVRRLLLLTGAEAIHGAMAQMLEHSERHMRPLFNFLRHPRGYLADPNLNTSRRVQEESLSLDKLIDLIALGDTALGVDYIDAFVNAPEDNNRARGALVEYKVGKSFDRFRTEWRTAVTTSVILNMASQNFKGALIDDLKAGQPLESIVAERFIRSVSRFWLEASKVTLFRALDSSFLENLEDDLDPGTVSPPLKGDRLSSYRRRPFMLRFPENAHFPSLIARVKEASKKRDLSKLDASGDDLPNGTLHLLFAFLLALYGRWLHASLNLLRVFDPDDADAVPDSPVEREACYLLAVIYRHMAREPALLRRSQFCLDLLGDEVDIRFEAERCSLHMTMLNYVVFLPHSGCEAILPPGGARNILKALRELYGRRDSNKLVDVTVRRMVATNLLQLAILAYQVSREDGEHLLQGVRPNIGMDDFDGLAPSEIIADLEEVVGDIRQASYVVQLVYIVARMLFSAEDKRDFEALRKWASGMFEEFDNAKNLPPYEKNRMEFCMRLIEQQAPRFHG